MNFIIRLIENGIKVLMPADIKHLMNMIFPNIKDEKSKYGIYKTSDINDLRNIT